MEGFMQIFVDWLKFYIMAHAVSLMGGRSNFCVTPCPIRQQPWKSVTRLLPQTDNWGKEHRFMLMFQCDSVNQQHVNKINCKISTDVEVLPLHQWWLDNHVPSASERTSRSLQTAVETPSWSTCGSSTWRQGRQRCYCWPTPIVNLSELLLNNIMVINSIVSCIRSFHNSIHNINHKPLRFLKWTNK